MNWVHFFEVWAWVSAVSAIASFICIVVADIEDFIDNRLWFIPASLVFLTAVFASIEALITK